MQAPNTTFGNSPSELLAHEVLRERLYLMTTNGTRCLLSLDNSNRIFIGALLNATVVAHKAYELAIQYQQTITLVCCGYRDLLEDDDHLTASFIARILSTLCAKINFHLKITDNIGPRILVTQAANRLINLGEQADVLFCSEVDKYTISPQFTPSGGVVV